MTYSPHGFIKIIKEKTCLKCLIQGQTNLVESKNGWENIDCSIDDGMRCWRSESYVLPGVLSSS